MKVKIIKTGEIVNIAEYAKITLDLTPYTSDQMKIRFNCYDTNNEGLQYWWQIDDVEITGQDATPDAITQYPTPNTHHPTPTTLQGHAVNHPRKGIYIVGNRKVVIR